MDKPTTTELGLRDRLDRVLLRRLAVSYAVAVAIEAGRRTDLPSWVAVFLPGIVAVGSQWLQATASTTIGYVRGLDPTERTEPTESPEASS